MQMPTQPQIDAALRHAYTSAGTLLAFAAVVAVIPQESVQPIIDALRQVGDGLQQVFGGASKLAIIVGPIVAGWMAKIAATSASIKNQAASLKASAESPKAAVAETAKTEILAAAAEVKAQ